MNLPPNFTEGPQSETRINEFGRQEIVPAGDWIRMRLGCATASRVEDAAFGFMKVKRGDKAAGDPTQARIDYMFQLALERLTGKAADHYVSRWMKEGRDKEPDARSLYEVQCGSFVNQVCFVQHREIDRAGASPDGVIILEENQDVIAPRYKLVEFKAPKEDTHFDYWFRQRNGPWIPPEYVHQMQWQMACAGPECLENDFCSYHPDFPDDMQLVIVPLQRDNKLIAEMEAGVRKFLAELVAMETEVERMRKDRSLSDSTIERQLRESIAHVRNGKPINYALANEIVP